MYKHALIATKAYPFHKGHEYLIETARRQSERVTVFVVWSSDQSPTGAVRADWVRKTYPDVDVRLIADISTDDDDPTSSELWAQYTRDIMGIDTPDVIFSSEEYGQRWASNLGVRHVMVDKHRTRIPISGTEIRNDPYLNWQYLNKYARQHYLKRVLIVGAESTGKTTLCKNLAAKYGTLYVPEYGRIYSECHADNRKEITPEQERIIFADIVNQQPKLAEEIEAEARLIVFHDTDLCVTSLWYQRWQPDNVGDELHKTILEAAQKMDNYDLIMLSSSNTDFVDDGYREFNQADRDLFTLDMYQFYSRRIRFLEGDWEARTNRAVELVNELFVGSEVTLP